MDIEYRSSVSAVMCVKNSGDSIIEAIESILLNKPLELIVVDGDSTDSTIEKLQAYPEVIQLSDRKLGLAHARNLGASAAKGKYVLFVGPDNILPVGFIENFLYLKNSGGLNAACVKTRIQSPKTYWDRGQDFRWRCLADEESRGSIVVGTPSLYDKKIFDIENFSHKNLGPNDDTEFCDRLVKRGFKLGQVNLIVFEKSGANFLDLWKRYKWYGTGDYFYFMSGKEGWRWKRKMLSITHPVRQFIRYLWATVKTGEVSYIPWLFCILSARYYGWISMVLRKKT